MDQRKLLDVVVKADMELRREADVQQLSVVKEEVPTEQQEWSSSLDQEDPEHPHIKEEPEELWTSQEGEQLQGLEEADIIKFPFSPVSVKSEDDEEKPQSSQLHQRQTEQMETEADGEDCGGPEPARNSDPHTPLQSDTDEKTSDSSEPETEDYLRDPDGKPFRCSVCAKTFKHRGNLNIHMRTHTGVKPFSCSLCNKSFTQKAGLDYHLRVHTGEKPFSCSVCGKTFRLKGAVTSHMTTHTGVKPFSCSVCNKRFRAASQLRVHKCVGENSWLHINQSDKHKKPLTCSECDATFPNNYLLVTHMRMHKGKKLFTCPVCGQKRQFSSHLEIHMRTHTGEKPYSCSICGKRFSQRGIMSQHMAVHSGVKPFSCTVCDRRFYWHFQVKKHKCLGESLQRRTTGLTGEDCGGSEPVSSDPDRYLQPPDTNKQPKTPPEPDDSVDIEFWKDTRQHQSGFTYRRNKKVSVNDGYNTGEKPFSFSDDKAETEPKTDDGVEAGDFSKQIRQPQSGLNHLNTEEVSVSDTGCNTDKKPFSSSEDGHTLLTHKKPFSCLFSGKGFATGGHLTRHTSVHTGEKPLSCTVCEKRFTLESQLIRHKCVESSRLDIANKLTSSSQCGKGFNRKHQLQVPMRVHTGLRPFGCSVCGKTFAKRESLRSHMTCHTGKEPFHCSVCNAGFSDSEALVQHMRIHTRQTQFSCTICGKEFAWRRYLTKHMEVHSKEKTYSCGYCDKTFTCHYQLKYHQCVDDQSSQLLQTQTEENREAEPPASSSTEQMETEADGDDCGGPEPARNSDPDRHPEPVTVDKTGDSSEPETDDSDDSDFWKGSSGRLSGLNSLKHDEVSQSDETFNSNHLLKIHRINHTGEEQFTERGSLSQHMAKQEDPEPPHIKEEQEELWTSQEGEQLQGLEEADIIKFPFTPVPVKSEDDEEKPQFSQLHQRLTEQMTTEADGEDCGGPEPARNSDPDTVDKTGDSSETETVESDDFWKETREPQSGLSSLKNNEISDSIMGCDSANKALSCSGVRTSECPEPESDDSVDSDFWKDNRKPPTGLNSFHKEEFEVNEVLESEMGYTDLRKPYSCPECGKRFLHDYNMKNHMKYHTGEKAFLCSVCGIKCLYKSHLEIHMRTHTREKPFPCPVCGKKYAHKASMQSHMAVHTVEKQYSCSVCDKGFAWFTELKYHQCVGESSHENTDGTETR
ncbi:oocyte zinc finger protein XlCOF7.1-like isoform X2 [Sebastes umbrosus]|uniref:oocyte zinc finger protein XlCOF7.1-like isoform X2 n=1 Tax=Sebastes umbrosus TaxID=72105 RepID=UPI00189DB2F2|nr:oocyte zinc finger protein XlCOF7.1-like isoform X2 [Sebastes umbrosus]